MKDHNTKHSQAKHSQNWDHLRPGDFVDVLDQSRCSYDAQIEVMADDARVIWVRRLALWTRHLLTNDGDAEVILIEAKF